MASKTPSNDDQSLKTKDASDVKIDIEKPKDASIDKSALQKPKDKDNDQLPFKRVHTCDDGCKFFSNHQILFILYCVFDLYLIVCGPMLLVCGNWANTGYFSLWTLTSNVWPDVRVENEDRTAAYLELLQLSCWIIGI